MPDFFWKESDHPHLKKLILEALAEDVGKGDITAQAIIPPTHRSCAEIIAKQKGILAGGALLKKIFSLINPHLSVTRIVEEGSPLIPHQVICQIKGQTRDILKAERVALNFLSHLSGIASMTHSLCQKVKKTKVKLLDTRKTIPRFRSLQKYAVRMGGGYNHRFGLFDRVLIKENHIQAAGSIREAIRRVRSRISGRPQIEIETKSWAEVAEAFQCHIDRILLDNMPLSEIRRVVKSFGHSVELESSGNINESNILQVAQTGVHYISLGCLTHSVKAFDFSLLIR